MRTGMMMAAAALLTGLLGTTAARSADMCEELWEQRNAVYAEAGYCFKTRRAIERFGNATCRYQDINDVPLSANARRTIQDIIRDERRLGCTG